MVSHSLLLLPSPALPSTRSIWQAEAFVISQSPTTLSCFCHARSSPFTPIHTITSSIEPALTQDHEDKQQSPFPSPSLFTGNHITFPAGRHLYSSYRGIEQTGLAHYLLPLRITLPTSFLGQSTLAYIHHGYDGSISLAADQARTEVGW